MARSRRRRRTMPAWGPAVALAVALVPQAATTSHTALERISVSPDGSPAHGYSWRPSMTPDGRYVAFESTAHNIVPGDLNRRSDIFVRDRWTGTSELVSLGWDGAQANGHSQEASISSDGRFVAFTSAATNLVGFPSGSHLAAPDVFVRDRAENTTHLVTRAIDGMEGAAYGEYPRLSADGGTVVFVSRSANLVAGKTNQCGQGGCWDVFAYDLDGASIERVSVASDGTQSDAHTFFSWVSGDGRSVVFSTDASTLVAGDRNGRDDVFLHDRETHETTRISMGILGTEASGRVPSISDDGRYIAYYSSARNIVPGHLIGTGVFVFDRATGETTLVSGTDHRSPLIVRWVDHDPPVVSADGRWVAFREGGSSLDPNLYTHVYVGRTDGSGVWRVSATPDGEPANYPLNSTPSISADGRLVAFDTMAWNLTGEREGLTIQHVVLRDRGEPTCPDGVRSEGRYSTVLEHGSAPGPIDPVRHDLGCALARNGL